MNTFKHQIVITEKRTKLISELYEFFGDDLFNQEKYHKVTETELKRIYDIFNSVIFNNKLPNDVVFNISLNIEDGKGYADVCELTEDNTLIMKNNFTIFYCPEHDDILLEIIDTIGHEMIHIYDVMYGPMKNYMNKIVKTNDKKQLEIDYDTHGYFFNEFVNKIYEQGIYINTKNYGRMRYFMEDDKINETDKEFNNENSVVRCAKRIFDGLNKGTKDGTVAVIVKDSGKKAIIRIS